MKKTDEAKKRKKKKSSEEVGITIDEYGKRTEYYS